MAVAPAGVELAPGHTAQWVWQQDVSREHGIPAGVILRHGACALYVAWSDDGGPYADDDQRWDLVSLVPLTLVQGVTCPRCGRTGIIDQGRWVDVERREVDG